jgi:thiosulfate reductase cytochrome b subunit
MADELVPRGELKLEVDANALPAPIRDALAPGTEPPPVPAQRSSHTNAAKLESEKVVLSAPLSYAGSAARIWKLTGVIANTWGRIGLGVAAVILIACAWWFVTAWYFFFGVLLVPYRLIRRGSRKRKREALQHREMMAAIQSKPER